MNTPTTPAKYDRIGKRYDDTRQADPYLVSRLLHHLQPEPGECYLDIGCGTGNYTRALATSGATFTGVDPSSLMLQRAQAVKSGVSWKQGNAELIPLENERVAGVMGTFTLHHWTDFKKAFGEIARVLKPQSKGVFLTSTPRQMEGYWLNHYFPNMLHSSVVQMPSLEVVRQAMNSAGLEVMQTEKYFVTEDLKDLFLYAGKQRPQLYLDPNVRRGISSFSALSNAQEVEEGLARLRADLDTGKINEVMKRFANEEGDYLFIIARKP